MFKNVVVAVVTFVVVVGLVRYTSCLRPNAVPVSPGGSQGGARPSLTDSGAQAPAVPQDPAVNAVIESLVGAWEKLSGVFARVETQIPAAAGKPGLTMGRGKYSCKREGSKALIWFELANQLSFDQEDKSKIVTAEYLRYVYDGQFLYVGVTQPKLATAAKRNYDPRDVLLIAGRDLFRSITLENKLSLLPDEDVDGKQAAVILATPLNGTWKTRHWFDRDTGLRLKMEETDASGKATLTITLKEIEVNPLFPADRFVFTPPEGAEIVDETRTKGTERPKLGPD